MASPVCFPDETPSYTTSRYYGWYSNVGTEPTTEGLFSVLKSYAGELLLDSAKFIWPLMVLSRLWLDLAFPLKVEAAVVGRVAMASPLNIVEPPPMLEANILLNMVPSSKGNSSGCLFSNTSRSYLVIDLFSLASTIFYTLAWSASLWTLSSSTFLSFWSA